MNGSQKRRNDRGFNSISGIIRGSKSSFGNTLDFDKTSAISSMLPIFSFNAFPKVNLPVAAFA